MHTGNDPFDDSDLSPAERQAIAEEQIAKSWRQMTEADVRRHVRNLAGHPMGRQLGRVLVIALQRYCPQHLALLPAHWRGADNDNRQGGTAA